MALFTTMPVSIMSPIILCMFSVVPVNSRVGTTPISARGTARITINGSRKRSNCAAMTM